MKKSRVNVVSVMTLSRHLLLLILLILIIPFVLMGCEADVEPENDHLQGEEYSADPVAEECIATASEKEYIPNPEEESDIAEPVSNMLENDPVMSLLGKNFVEIEQELGEPDEKGYSGRNGAHYYILYSYEEGFIQFSSPESLENEIALSITLGPGQEVLDAEVGMRFSEIADILGEPDFGPGIGMDNLYYMDYFRGEINTQLPEVIISFVADSMNSPTDHAFIKWEKDVEEILLLAAK